MRLQLGYIPLCDAAPLIMAQELGFARTEGLDLDLTADRWACAVDEAVAHVREVLAGPLADGALGFEVTDAAPGALPGLGAPAAAELVAAAGGRFRAKYGWTDVARFSAAGIPAVNLGPGDPMLCHTDDEHCPVAQIEAVAQILRVWLA